MEVTMVEYEVFQHDIGVVDALSLDRCRVTQLFIKVYERKGIQVSTEQNTTFSK